LLSFPFSSPRTSGRGALRPSLQPAQGSAEEFGPLLLFDSAGFLFLPFPPDPRMCSFLPERKSRICGSWILVSFFFFFSTSRATEICLAAPVFFFSWLRRGRTSFVREMDLLLLLFPFPVDDERLYGRRLSLFFFFFPFVGFSTRGASFFFSAYFLRPVHPRPLFSFLPTQRFHRDRWRLPFSV